MAGKTNLTLTQLSEIRTTIALSRAHYKGQHNEVGLLLQLVSTEENHIFALRSLIHSLLCELDGPKRDADEFMNELAEITAMCDAQP